MSKCALESFHEKFDIRDLTVCAFFNKLTYSYAGKGRENKI